MNLDTTPDRPLFSIFIPTWNNLPMLRLCVDSIEKNSTYPHEIIIHVNDGSDGTLEWVRSRGLKHTHSAENIGICWAMNGMRPLATTDYIAFVNDDMYLLPGWDEALYSRIREESSDLWFMASTVIQRVGHSRRPRAIRVADYGSDADTFREGQLLDEYRRYEQPDWRGAVQPPCVVSRRAWDLVGGYSVEFSPGWASDPDFNAKLWLAGCRTYRGVGSSLCYHFMSKSVHRVVKNNGTLQFLRKFGITVRVFQEKILRIDEPWDSEYKPDCSDLRIERIRGRLKKFYTYFKPSRTASVWDNFFPKNHDK